MPRSSRSETGGAIDGFGTGIWYRLRAEARSTRTTEAYPLLARTYIDFHTARGRRAHTQGLGTPISWT
jgi:hypothetical protein